MTELIRSIIERRDKLGWTQKMLAEKSDVPLSAIYRIEKGLGQWEELISLLDKVLSKAISEIKKTQEIEEIILQNQRKKGARIIYKNIPDSTEKDKWAKNYNFCIKCGTKEIRHIARGLCKNCYDRDIEKRHKDKNHIQKYGESSLTLTREYLINNYVVQQKSLSDIAKNANCTRQYVHKQMVRYHIPFRSKSSAREIALQKEKIQFERTDAEGIQSYITLKKVNVNENFFSSWSSEMAYVLGVIYTDGNLNPGRIREPHRSGSSTIPLITVSQKDPGFLEKILNLMNCDAKLVFHKQRQYGKIVAGELYHFQIPNEIIYDDLTKLGLTPRKSLTLSFPAIPDQWVRHFIRGCWDGDGSVYREKQSGKINAHFVSGSFVFVEGIVSHLIKAGLPRTTIYTNKRETPSYYIRYTGSKVPQLFHYLYDDVPNTQYLERKYILFKQSLDMNLTISNST